ESGRAHKAGHEAPHHRDLLRFFLPGFVFSAGKRNNATKLRFRQSYFRRRGEASSRRRHTLVLYGVVAALVSRSQVRQRGRRPVPRRMRLWHAAPSLRDRSAMPANVRRIKGETSMERIALAALAASAVLCAQPALAQPMIDWEKIEIKATDL